MFELIDGETPEQRRELVKRQRKESIDFVNKDFEERRQLPREMNLATYIVNKIICTLIILVVVERSPDFSEKLNS